MPVWVLVLYSVLFYGAWTLNYYVLIPILDKIENGLVAELLIDGVFKNLVWTLPALLLVAKYSDCLEVPFKEMLTWKKEYLPYLALFPGLGAYLLFSMFVQKQPIQFSLVTKEVVTVLFVGITEELVFRAWLLNATMPYAKTPESEDETPWQRYAVIGLNALMFLAIHFPRWVSDGLFVENFTNFGFVTIILLSVIFSLLFLKTKNILLPIALHMFWDLLIFMFD